MHETRGKDILVGLRKKWMYNVFLSHFLTALGLAIFILTLLHKLYSISFYWSLPCSILLFLITTIFNRSWKLNEWHVSKFLNTTQPSLEESAQLFLKSQSSLNLLEKLQVKKIEQELHSIKAPNPFKKQFITSLIILLVTVAISLAIIKIPFNSNLLSPASTVKQVVLINKIPESLLPEIKNTNIIIAPPAYTRKGLRKQNKFNLLAEEGAIVSWQIQTNIPAKEINLIFNDGKRLELTHDAENLDWKAQSAINTSGFYQVKIDSSLSDLYKIESVKDQPPTIVIQSPKPAITINYGESEKVMIRAALADDYGIKAATISGTVSTGQGEAVKFKEQRLLSENFNVGKLQYHLQKLIDCKALGMQPGDELYFFISTTDNHKQEARSDMYVITLQDTTDLMSMDGIVTNLDIRSEFFRSERQIIIETEQLLKDKATITAEEFKKKSNDLGIDQMLLRQRYGKFLGEETSPETGGDTGYNKGLNSEGIKDNANQIVEQFEDKHDNAEDATFFDPATKKQLKDMLSEMWNAELKLRTFAAKEALPFEYKALRLLKDLQQKSRAYVLKTGFKSTPLNPDKRLTGDLTKIDQPVTRENLQNSEIATTITRKALGTLEQLKVNGEFNVLSQEILQQAFQQLSTAAAKQPGVYLTPLSSLRKILIGSGSYKPADIDNAERGLQKMSAFAQRLPYSNTNADMDLSKQYFMNLNKASR